MNGPGGHQFVGKLSRVNCPGANYLGVNGSDPSIGHFQLYENWNTSFLEKKKRGGGYHVNLIRKEKKSNVQSNWFNLKCFGFSMVCVKLAVPQQQNTMYIHKLISALLLRSNFGIYVKQKFH